MVRSIYEAAVEGSVISLLNLLQEDPLILDRITAGCYAETPLHIAAMLGHTEFVQEILNRKPQLAGELDSRKSSPLHLATAKGYLDIVKKLVSVNPEMCFARDRDGRNPLHIAAIKGHISVLRELVQVRPDAARVLMDRGETILHVCVRYNQFEAMKFLVETLSDRDLVNSKNNDGNNILHTAVADKQVEAINFLTTSGAMEVNALNANGLTATDILARSVRDVKDWEIGELLRNAGGITAKDDGVQLNDLGTTQNTTSTPHGHVDNQTKALHQKAKDSKTDLKRHDGNWLENKRNAMLVVASVIAVMAFLAALNPPGGVWQDTVQGNATTRPHRAGFAIMEDFDPDEYRRFINYNTTSLVTSLGTILILILISDLPVFRRRFFTWILMAIMWVGINATILTYTTAVTTMAEEYSYLSLFYIIFVWICFTFGVLLLHIIRVIVWMVRFLKKLMRRRRRRLASTNSTDLRRIV